MALRVIHDTSFEVGGQAWRLTLARPLPPLCDVADLLWYIEGGSACLVSRVLPLGHSFLMFNLAAAQRVVSGSPQVYATAWLSAQHDRALDIDALGPSRIVGVRLAPHGAWHLLGIPQRELTDTVVELEALLNGPAVRLREQLGEAAEPARCLRLLADWLLTRWLEGRTAHPAIAWATNQLVCSPGAVSGLAAELGYSRKHLAWLFQREIGVSPHTYARIRRFSATVSQIRTGRSVSWTNLAQICGYYDQSHLIREFRAFAGMTPEELSRAEIDDLGLLILTRS
ncbi:helix-turn-helix domain-containing protein [Nonomuraea typhae]|uniref:helix-turn-helix domain-containing protein n=1 Tax=Nonomuraea typhae TaxID=2603600 RepID=UPI0012F94CA5|nr:AraC family transcriptional regulator [Nonomuraea typhae]